MNFISLQRFIGEFLDVRRAMNCPAHGGDFAQREAEGEEDGEGGDGQSAGGSGCPAHAQVPGENNGIDGFLEVLSRGTYLVPPRSLRALPTPNGEP
jgi:hypothetical protein